MLINKIDPQLKLQFRRFPHRDGIGYGLLDLSSSKYYSMTFSGWPNSQPVLHNINIFERTPATAGSIWVDVYKEFPDYARRGLFLAIFKD
jgi:hypothetical protein